MFIQDYQQVTLVMLNLRLQAVLAGAYSTVSLSRTISEAEMVVMLALYFTVMSL